MAGKVKVTYTDGREVEVRVGPRAEVEVERKFSIAFHECEAFQHLYYAAWAALHFSGQENAEFDAFLDAIEDIVTVEAPAEPVDPTRKVRRRGGTSS